MQQIKIHSNGPGLSRVVAGVWRWHTVNPKQVEDLITTAMANGITSFDHADIYGNYSGEEVFGHILRNNSSLRNQIQIITKCGIKLISAKRPNHAIKHYDSSMEHIVWSVENSLKLLATDRIDLLLIHRPDPLMDPHEVAEVFSSLKQSGKVLHFGVSNFTGSQMEMLQSYLPFPLVTNQIELSLFKNESLFDGTVDTLMKHRMSPMAWSPLGGGKYFDNEIIMNNLKQLAEKYNATTTQLLLAWLLKHPSTIIPIIGTTKQDRIQEAASSVKIDLDRQHWFEMLKWATGSDVA